MVRHFPVLHFPDPVILPRVGYNFVRHFPVMHFQVVLFQSPHRLSCRSDFVEQLNAFRCRVSFWDTFCERSPLLSLCLRTRASSVRLFRIGAVPLLDLSCCRKLITLLLSLSVERSSRRYASPCRREAMRKHLLLCTTCTEFIARQQNSYRTTRYDTIRYETLF